jgi:hypothetical protein
LPPDFPITIHSVESADEVVATLDELVATMEYLDSEDEDLGIWVTDAHGRPVTVRVENHMLVRLDLVVLM